MEGVRESGDEFGAEVLERAIVLLQQLQEPVRLLTVYNPYHRSTLLD